MTELERELAALLSEPGYAFADVRGAGLATTVTLIAESGDVRRFRGDAASDAGCCAWDDRRAFNSVRPITPIRTLLRVQLVRAWAGHTRTQS